MDSQKIVKLISDITEEVKKNEQKNQKQIILANKKIKDISKNIEEIKSNISYVKNYVSQSQINLNKNNKSNVDDKLEMSLEYLDYISKVLNEIQIN